jgi:Tfp pilus assembly protein PilN
VIRTNLSTRPFYNEGRVGSWLLAIALIVLAATIFNVSRVLHYSRSDTELALQASRDEARAADLRVDAARLRASVDMRQIAAASQEAHQANDLIDRRTFSWTELFNRFETTLPPDVRITSVRPRLEEKNRQIVLAITVLARSVDDVNQFMENLEATRAFAEIGARLTERVNEEGQLEAAFETAYVPHPAASPGPTPSTGSGRQAQ